MGFSGCMYVCSMIVVRNIVMVLGSTKKISIDNDSCDLVGFNPALAACTVIHVQLAMSLIYRQSPWHFCSI